MYGCLCVYALYSNTLKLYATKHMMYTLTCIWSPCLILKLYFTIDQLMHPKDADGMANSVDPDTGAVSLISYTVCPDLYVI